MTAVLLMVAGTGLATAAHLTIRVAERHARRAYEELVGEDAARYPPDDAWKGIRSLTGNWGCVVAVLEFLRGLGVAVALGAGIYFVANQ